MHAVRRDRLRAEVSRCADGLVIVDSADLRYLTGFSGSNGALFVSSAQSDGDVFSTDSRYADQVAVQCPDLGVLVARNCLEAVVQQCVSQGADHIAIDAGLTTRQVAAIESAGVNVVHTQGLVAALRETKDVHEITAIEEACAITSGALNALIEEIRVGDTEIRLARRLEQLFGEFGAEDRAFPTIVASGAHSARPHHEPGMGTLQEGDLLVIDCGARVRGYHADMTRTFIVGEPSSCRLNSMHWSLPLPRPVEPRQGQALRSQIWTRRAAG